MGGMHYCEAADAPLRGRSMPTNNWMRDDRLGGLRSDTDDMLQPVFDGLLARSQLGVAIAEKKDAVNLWSNIEETAKKMLSITTRPVPGSAPKRGYCGVG